VDLSARNAVKIIADNYMFFDFQERVPEKNKA